MLSKDKIQSMYDAAVRGEFARNNAADDDEVQESSYALGCELEGVGGLSAAIRKLIDKARAADNELLSLREKLAELKALPAIPKALFEIGELIRTQDNRITDQPFFAVMVKREIISSEDHDYDRICWVENQSGDYCEATDTQHRRLEAIYQAKYEVREGWDRYAMKEIDVFVTGCFTEQGCKDYICRNRHNMNKPFVYAFGSYRNNEYQVVRNFLQSLTAAKPS
ncbi:hypothetical protein [Yersinia intermedia]|uniref:hypothetical protein n=1 Tax=Yersinia intermedia TaxID=631 RepID=UPI0005DBBE5B|nr:hypothetical protein [Yersinia intermedia]CNH97200.1 Uncharacterised protein [Yersinia intermedia]